MPNQRKTTSIGQRRRRKSQLQSNLKRFRESKVRDKEFSVSESVRLANFRRFKKREFQVLQTDLQNEKKKN
jgi:hypothetical protein